MREITTHTVNPANDRIKINVTDEPGPGGANHRYEITGFDGWNPSGDNPSVLDVPQPPVTLVFQNGAIPEAGVNGVTQEALIAILIDRLQGFQHQRKDDGSFDFSSRGRFACRENAIALTHLEEAQMWLQKRTRDRMARGVEGTHQK